MKPTRLAFLLLPLAVCSCNIVSQDAGPSGPVPPPTDASQMLLKSADGYHQIAVADVISLDVRVSDGNSPGLGSTERHFAASTIPAVLGGVGLNAPSEPGFPSAMVTGDITMELQDGTVRHFDILNESRVQDHDHVEAIYTPRQALDVTWLESF